SFTYNLQGGSVTTGGLIVGLSSDNAVMNQSGGTASAATQLVLGLNGNSVGTYNLSGPSTVTLGAGKEIIGQSGTGTFTQAGGINTVTHTLTIAQNPSASGTYDLKNGTLSAETITVNQGGSFKLGGGKVEFGTLTIAGGTVTASGDEIVAAAGSFATS